MAYLFIENNKINGCGEVPALDEATINYEITDAFYQEFQQNSDKYIWDGLQVVENPNYDQEQAKERQDEFEANFFEIPAIDGIFQGGYYRKVPKGYQSAVESINTAFNAVNVLGLLPQDYLIFYTKPDFTDETQCTEEWLVANQFRNQTMTAQEFGQFYVAFMTGWNNQEHKEVV